MITRAHALFQFRQHGDELREGPGDAVVQGGCHGLRGSHELAHVDAALRDGAEEVLFEEIEKLLAGFDRPLADLLEAEIHRLFIEAEGIDENAVEVKEKKIFRHCLGKTSRHCDQRPLLSDCRRRIQ